MTQPSMFSDSMLLSEARSRADRLKPLLEGPDQQALDVILGRLDLLERVAKLARDVRKAQNAFFHKKGDLGTAKALESRLDGLLKE